MDMWITAGGDLVCLRAPDRKCPLADICEDSNRCVLGELREEGFRWWHSSEGLVFPWWVHRFMLVMMGAAAALGVLLGLAIMAVVG